MRIISGKWRGRKLNTPKNEEVRPTSDMVKESAFNIIQFEIEGASVLDLFCGTGQLGLEALSRGAKSCVFTDESPEAIALTLKNTALCGAQDSAEILRREAVAYLKSARRKFDVVFLDPPYDTELLGKTLETIFAFDILNPGGIIVCESRSDKPLPEAEPPYSAAKSYRYGKIKLSLYRRGE
ncbi:MAG: 16S rRNA (guanine(966)-N(2))-methyltransferase RsmD [Oscillospiraceae bacterium]|jgi:16S rRNA (guanine(966)-N(2))-methyltransferase RsmD|nr:16S rRNA (guanine(966)-N(2))-methyltransferase RsmD [Oscillospiraceae bacterium]